MIVLDTNVVSETMRPACNPVVSAWLDRQKPETLFLTSTSLGELLAGIASMPEGRRKFDFFSMLDAFRTRMIQTPLLTFDEAAATEYGSLMQRGRLKGRPILIAEGQIAAIALAHGFTVATRDTGPFEAAGVRVVNPWEALK
jgi:predicted nucleic acid-binding protein